MAWLRTGSSADARQGAARSWNTVCPARRRATRKLCVLRCPPVAQFSFRIEFPTLIVEAVRQFVSNNATDRAIVNRRIGFR